MSLLLQLGLGLEYFAFIISLFRNKRVAALTVASIILINILLLFFLGEV